ncbi:MAG: M28 family peptidase [Aquimonas sp.]|nr:M28 family peptidase [Aquimonas sp.]
MPLDRLLPPALLAALLLAPAAEAAPHAGRSTPLPTVVVDIHAAGSTRVEALKAAEGVQWFAEFGNELLLGVEPESLAVWLTREGVRAGPPALAADELVVRDLVCGVHSPEPVLDTVGGYSLVRRPAPLARAAGLVGVGGRPLPADGVIAWEVANRPEARAKGAADAQVQALVDRIDTERWFAAVEDLSTFNRNSFNPELAMAHDWILARFAGAGLATSSHTFELGGASCNPQRPLTTLANPIGFRAGTTRPDEWIVVGAHYDARNNVLCDTSTQPQPGANDNASGCAGVIELARAFQGLRTERSLVFACFAGEEQGLVGARAWVGSLQSSGELARIQHMINLDMIAHAINDSLAARAETTPAHAGQLARYADAAALYAPELGLILSTNTQAYSDHWPFIERGIPGVFTWENGAGIYPHYHQATDLPQNMARAHALAGGILRMDAAVLAGLAVLMPPLLFADGFEANASAACGTGCASAADGGRSD